MLSDTITVEMARQITRSVTFFNEQPIHPMQDSQLIAAYTQYANRLVEATSRWRELVQWHQVWSKFRDELVKAAEKEETQWLATVKLDPSLL